jgi:hypothetical protein
MAVDGHWRHMEQPTQPLMNEARRDNGGDARGGEPHSVGDILDKLRELAGKGDKVRLGDVVEAVGKRSFGPFLLIPAMIDISPIGSIPGLPTVLAVVIAITAVQLLLGRDHLWLPGFLANRSRKSEDVKKAADKLDGLARRLDGWFHNRLPRLTTKPFQRMAAVIVLLLTLTVPPLELLPLATTAPMAAIAAFGLALLVHDGLLMLIAGVLSLGAIALGLGLVSSTGVLGGGGEGG